MRYDCDDPAFEGDYIELSDAWTRAQVRAIWDAAGKDEAAFLDLLRPKVITIHLSCIDAPPITDPAELTPAGTEPMDTRLYRWFGGVWVAHLNHLSDLGNALRRRLFDISATQMTIPADPVSQNHLSTPG